MKKVLLLLGVLTLLVGLIGCTSEEPEICISESELDAVEEDLANCELELGKAEIAVCPGLLEECEDIISTNIYETAKAVVPEDVGNQTMEEYLDDESIQEIIGVSCNTSWKD